MWQFCYRSCQLVAPILVFIYSPHFNTYHNVRVLLQTRIEIANKAAAYFINTVPAGSLIGIVEFQSAAYTISTLYSVDSQADRKHLIAMIPTSSGGGTCIGCGITKAIEVSSALTILLTSSYLRTSASIISYV